ncbi:UDP-N-acetylglucosamine 2-epimerase (non-hydrolyzing) [Methanolinea mesophila]|uniref:non-hydrolyzing UDP-N-acetylglucosamine 2-epimerase n=1 Tax=Methanolinea mesophila TaxID=547055 RepID=UPI001AEA643D|nr:UDP-N-acetylglucosamine 2-epimerase (non-hydrolyzing) [Methanolinea mesophila]MBP1927934.1 UDP-N-acetylglucosamine 2-epimerase (non-hydrolyzing) [Methanolinea mesophila]
MKVLTVLGTRPEIIRLSQVIRKLDQSGDHTLVHTGQNYDVNLSDIFFRDLNVREPDYYLGVKSSTFGEQVGTIIQETEKILVRERPDRLLILGDTNSSLSAFVAKRLGVPVFHMEAGNRCYDDRVPEEINRRVIDHCSDILMPYTERSCMNLLREGIPGEKIFVIGNPIYEVLLQYRDSIESSSIMEKLGIERGSYLLATLHRAENVDDPQRLRSIVKGLNTLHSVLGLPVIVSVHPRTKARLELADLSGISEGLRFCVPFGFIDFINLERNAYCVISDSGTVQEECCIFKVPNVTIRDVTERPETIESGSNMLSGADEDMIVQCVRTVTELSPSWIVPREYLVDNVSGTVLKIVKGYSHFS